MRELLWSGKIKEVEPPEFGQPYVWFDCDYDSGLLLMESPHLLKLNHNHKFPGRAGQRFGLILEKMEYPSMVFSLGEVILWQGLFSGFVFDDDSGDVLAAMFSLEYSAEIITTNATETETGLALEKNINVDWLIGDRFRLILQLED